MITVNGPFLYVEPIVPDTLEIYFLNLSKSDDNKSPVLAPFLKSKIVSKVRIFRFDFDFSAAYKTNKTITNDKDIAFLNKFCLYPGNSGISVVYRKSIEPVKDTIIILNWLSGAGTTKMISSYYNHITILYENGYMTGFWYASFSKTGSTWTVYTDKIGNY